jgi:hypothetical protein
VSEAENLANIRLDIGADPDVRLFRFQVGRFQLIDLRWITVGVPGMSDTLGWKTITITPEMVGRRVPVFVAIEVKKKGARTGKKRLELQTSFHAQVRRHGGLAGFATSPAEARQILNQPPGAVVQSPDE